MLATRAKVVSATPMQVLTRVDPPELQRLVARDAFFWLDLVDPTDEDLAILGAELRLHPLALEDTREFGQRPKLDRYGDRVLLVFASVRLTAPEDPRMYEPVEVHLHISGGFVVTARRIRSPELDALHAPLVGAPDASEDYLLYRILDGLTDAHYPVLEALEATTSPRSRASSGARTTTSTRSPRSSSRRTRTG